MEDFEKRKIPGFATAHFLELLFLGIPFILTPFIGMLLDQLGVGMIVAVSIGIIGFARQWLRFHRFICPNCDKHLRASRFELHAPIVFKCDRCRILWDSGFTHAHDQD